MTAPPVASAHSRKKKPMYNDSQSRKKFKPNNFKKQQRAIGAVANVAPEWKAVDSSNTLTGVLANSWSPLYLLNGIAQGSSLANRIGQRVAVRSIILRGTITCSVNNTDARIMIFYDNATHGVAPIITDVLSQDSFYSPNLLNTNDRFLILADFYPFHVAGTTTGTVGFKKHLKFTPALNQTFNGITSAITGAVESGGIFIAACGAASIVSCTYFARVRYTDS